MSEDWGRVVAKLRSIGLTSAAALLLAMAPHGAGAYDDPSECLKRPYAIQVFVSDVRSGFGNVSADLHGDDPEKFLDEELMGTRVAATEGTTLLCLWATKPGTYAISVYHDENDNRRFDKSWLGLPAEPFGVSNNPGFRFGPPSHGEAVFTVDSDGAVVEIVLRRVGEGPALTLPRGVDR